MVMFRCRTPVSLARVMAIANGDSVTVSIAADINGTANTIPAKDMEVSIWVGTNSLQPGTTNTSSKVSASEPESPSSSQDRGNCADDKDSGSGLILA